MMHQKILHPKSGANCAWVPSPTAAGLHVLHYHEIDVFSKHKELKKRKHAKLDDLLEIPIKFKHNWSKDQISKELRNNAKAYLVM